MLMYRLLKQRCKQPQKCLEQPLWQADMLQLAECDRFADGKNSLKIMFDIAQNRSATDQDPIFKLEMETAVIHVDRSGDTEVIIAQDRLGMQETG